MPLYSCLHTLREQYRSQNCDNFGTTLSLVAVKKGFILIKYLCIVCVCVKGTVWIEQDKCGYILHMEGQAQYVEGVLQGELG